MSSMLEQAIVDAQALREAALKNAEQALIEKFTPQIKEAVESLLEGDIAEKNYRKVSYEGRNYNLMELDGGKATLQEENGSKPFVVNESELGEAIDENLLQEEEMDLDEMDSPEQELTAPFANPMGDPKKEVEYTVGIEDQSKLFEIDLEELKKDMAEEPGEPVMPEEKKETPEEILADLDLQEEKEDNEDDLVNEIMKIMNEMGNEEKDEEVLEEELIVDMGQRKTGYHETFEPTLQYEMELEAARKESSEMEEELEKEKKENEKLKESLKHFKHKNKQYKDAVEKLSEKLNETLLSNAKLLYSNKTLSDASLNERQKTKIVEAIAKSRTPEEAKHLCETLNATVTSSRDNKSPRTLSESVNRKSNLSGILNTRKQRVNESVEHNFADKMKKLAGIK